MSSALYRRARRAEAGAKRIEDRRRLRLEFFRSALAEGFDSLKAMHAVGASGQEAVQGHAHFVDDVLHSLTTLIAADSAGDGLTLSVSTARSGDVVALTRDRELESVVRAGTRCTV